MNVKNYIVFCCLLGCLFSVHPLVTFGATPVQNTSDTKAALIEQLLLQLRDLQEQLKNFLKYKDHIPLNTVAAITGPRTVVAGVYNTWDIVTKNNDPENAGDVMIEWGDGMTSVTGNGHTYNTPGEYTLVVKNHDGNGQEASSTAKITVVKNPQLGRLTAWGNALVSSESLIPKNLFRAYFFNTRTFTTTVAPENISDIYFAYPGEKTKHTEQFPEHSVGAYWVGLFTYSKNTTLYFDFTNPQWDNARFIIDGKVFINTSLNMPTDAARKITLTPGTHIIEIEYMVNWHAGFFRAKIGTTDPAYMDIGEAKVAAQKIAGTNAVIVPLHQYSAENSETEMIVATIPNDTTPKILDLATYESDIWDVRGARGKGVKAIIVSSFSGAADVINADGIPVFHTRHYSK